jgi:L-alanine-DL-glutamate epimerase-like enolase superfamily enzyme
MPAADFADVDGPLLLAKDIATGLKYSYGKVEVSSGPGLGISYIPPVIES